eukprot:jgi/Mesvir1/19179/Mv25578-RA.1
MNLQPCSMVCSENARPTCPTPGFPDVNHHPSSNAKWWAPEMGAAPLGNSSPHNVTSWQNLNGLTKPAGRQSETPAPVGWHR